MHAVHPDTGDAPLGERPLPAKSVSARGPLVAKATNHQMDRPSLIGRADLPEGPPGKAGSGRSRFMPSSRTLTDAVRAGETDQSSKQPPHQYGGDNPPITVPGLVMPGIDTALDRRRGSGQYSPWFKPPGHRPATKWDQRPRSRGGPIFPAAAEPLERCRHWQKTW